MKQVQVENLTSSKGNLVPNQFKITTKDSVYFQSYKTLIARINKRTNKIYLDKNYWDYSRTTSKYLYSFLAEFSGVRLNKKTIIKLANDKNYNIYFKNLN